MLYGDLVMSTSTALASGRVEFTPRPVVPTPQRGGRRPPTNRNKSSKRLRPYPLVRLLTPRGYRRARNALQFCTVAGLSFVATVLFLSSVAAAQPNPPLPDLAGTYKCEGEETVCGWSGWTFTVTQSGADLEIKNEKGDTGYAKPTSRISLSAGPTWNMLGTIVSADNRVIQWSNGTTWRKQ
jgi:hypothetical protein